MSETMLAILLLCLLGIASGCIDGSVSLVGVSMLRYVIAK